MSGAADGADGVRCRYSGRDEGVTPPSSSGLGLRPFKPPTGVRVPLGAPTRTVTIWSQWAGDFYLQVTWTYRYDGCTSTFHREDQNAAWRDYYG